MSKINEVVRSIGRVRMLQWDEHGNLVLDREEDNLVVTTGLDFIASRMVGTAQAVMSHMALGTGATAPALAQVALVSEIGRTALASAVASGAVVTYNATFNPGVATGAIAEAGIMNAAVNGTMLNRVIFSVVNKAAGDTLALTWNVTIA